MSRWIIGLSSFSLMAFSALAGIAAPPEGPRVHSLIIVTGESNLRTKAIISARALQKTLLTARKTYPDTFMPPHVLGGEGDAQLLSAEDVDKAVKKAFSAGNEFGPDDTIFCYVLEHGGHWQNNQKVQTEEFEHAHFFQLEKKRRVGTSNHAFFARVDLFELLLDMRQNASKSKLKEDRLRGLTVLISDSCNNAVKIDSDDEAAPAPSDTIDDMPLFVNLLTKYQGQVSVNSSKTNELAWYGTKVGGRFTNHLLLGFKNEAETTDWPGLIQVVRQKLIDEFPKEGKADSNGKLYYTQTPMWMRNPTRVSAIPAQ